MMKSMIVKTATKTATIIPTTFSTPHIVKKTVRSDYEHYLKVFGQDYEFMGTDKLMGKAEIFR